MKTAIEPKIVRPFSQEKFVDIRNHLRELRRAFEGTPLHDANQSEENRFNRWWWHNHPLLKKMHDDPEFVALASAIFGEAVRPSYVFLSMYGDQGICPGHVDRPQCKYTIDLCIAQGKPWEIFVGENQEDKVGKPYLLMEGEALCYSGTDQWHYRNRIEAGNWIDLAFFHFVPVGFEGRLN